MKVVVCNMGYSGYWVACWRELMKHVELKIFTPETKYPYPQETIAGIPIQILSADEMASRIYVAQIVIAEKPDVLIISGWASLSFKALAANPELSTVTKILIVDSSWEGSWRQILSRFRLWNYVRKFDGIIVGGNRGRTFARWIGFKPSQIFRSIYGYDADAFGVCFANRIRKPCWPKRFCYVGRYVPIKGLSILMAAYAQYRQKVSDPWPLDCYGNGELASALAHEEGVINKGFVKPLDLPRALIDEGVFVFPSLHEPWGVALVEAAGAGLPLICSNKVTSSDDVVQDGENGYVVKAGDVVALRDALISIHNRYEELPRMGERSVNLAADFAPNNWAARWMEAFHALGR